MTSFPAPSASGSLRPETGSMLRRCRLLIAGAGTVFIAAQSASCGGSPNDGIPHPVPEALAELARSATATVRSDTTPPAALGSRATAWAELRRSILDARPGPVMGAFQQHGEESAFDVLGGLINVALGAHGETHVLDAMNGRVVVFDSIGRVSRAFGRIGDGPLEFRTARDLWILGDTTFVAQAGLIKVITRTANGYRLDRQIRVQSDLTSLCVRGGSAFGSARRQPSAVVREYDLDVENERRAFGTGYVHGWEYAQQRLSVGLVACPLKRSPARVVYGHELLPVLDGYGASGERIWSSIVLNYVQGYRLETPAGSLVSPQRPLDMLMALNAASGFVLASYSRTEVDGMISTRTYLLDDRTGEGGLVEATEAPNREIVAIAADRYVTYVQGDYPRLQLWHLVEPQ